MNSKGTLFELDNRFCASEVYLSSDVIKPNYRINFRSEGNKSDAKVLKHDGNKERSFDKRPNYEQNRSYNNNSGQFKQGFNKNYGNNSGQFKQGFRNSGQFKNKVESMEVDNLVEVEEKNEEVEVNEVEGELNGEVNFH